MPNYLCLQRSLPVAGTGSEPEEKPCASEMQSMFERFQAWKASAEGHIVDLGGRLGEGRVASHDSVGDGPYVEIKELVGGYMILSADDLESAIRIASGVPGLVSKGSGVEVIEIRSQP